MKNWLIGCGLVVMLLLVILVPILILVGLFFLNPYLGMTAFVLFIIGALGYLASESLK